MKDRNKLPRATKALPRRKRTAANSAAASTGQPSPVRGTQAAEQWQGEERRSRKERRQEKIQLAEMGQLAASIAHELRQPLGTIRNLTYYLKTKIGTSDQTLAEKFARLDQQTELAGRILSNLVAFGRSGIPHKSAFRLDEILKEVLGRISWKPQILLDLKMSRRLPLICADPLHADRILANVIGNALESMDSAGALTIAARAERASRRRNQRGMVIVEVKDTGCGIDPARGGEIFRPFVSTKTQGTGLGLALSLQLAEANGGSLVFRSQPGRGTTFELRLPTA